MSAPDLIHPVIGFRRFLIDDDAWLAATNVGGIWKPGLNVAKCRADRRLPAGFYSLSIRREEPPPFDHKAPHERCSCGLYAKHKVAEVPDANGPSVIAAVVAEGRLATHPAGFRAEKARVVALGIPENGVSEGRLQIIAAAYGAVAVPEEELETVALRYGTPVPEGMLPGEKKLETPMWQQSSSAQWSTGLLSAYRTLSSPEPSSSTVSKHLSIPRMTLWWAVTIALCFAWSFVLGATGIPVVPHILLGLAFGIFLGWFGETLTRDWRMVT